MRTVSAESLAELVAGLCIEANVRLPDCVGMALTDAMTKETSQVAGSILGICLENLKVAARENMPVCQDTGMAVIFVELGQEVFIDGGFEDAVNEGVRRGYKRGRLRNSIVSDPLERINTGDNTPAVIHLRLLPGDEMKVTVAPKGFGSENMSRLVMLNPSAGEEEVIGAVVEAVRISGANPCPPIVIGVGLGGTAEACMLEAKRSLLRPIGSAHENGRYNHMEREILERVNALGIGPQGMGGRTTALAAHIRALPTHIAGLPVAVNICCHVLRHAEGKL